MRHMGNVKQKMIPLFYLIPIIVFIYYRLYEETYIGNKVIEFTKNKVVAFLKKNNEIDGIIYGGSNAALGISAEQLSIYTRKKFYNLSLISEGEGQVDLHNYLNATIPYSVKNKMEVILYSSIHIYDNSIPEKKLITSILPSRRLLPTLIDFFELRKNYLYPFDSTPYGDYIFYTNPTVKTPNTKLSLPTITQSVNKIKSEKQAVNRIFPNAKFIVLFPPIYTSTNRTVLENYLKELSKELTNNQISFVHVPLLRNINQFRIDNRHLNSNGRIIHTKQLFDALNQKIL